MIINKIFFKSIDLNVYLPRINSLYNLPNDNINYIFYVYSVADLKLLTFYYIINIIITVSLFTCYYNTIYKLPNVLRYTRKQFTYLLFYF